MTAEMGSLETLVKSPKMREKCLSTREARKRLKHFGLNELSFQKPISPISLLWAHVKKPLPLLLAAAASLSLVLKHHDDFLVILIMLFLSLGLDFVQEYTAKKAIQKLKNTVTSKARVLRDGKVIFLPLTHLVPGDVVLLKSGDLVPADGELLETFYFSINQSALTGESAAIEKSSGKTVTNLSSPLDSPSMVFMGSSVLTGEAILLVSATGKNTYLSSISNALETKPLSSQFDLDMTRIGIVLFKIVLVLIGLIFLSNFFLHHSWVTTALFVLAIMISMTPEFLPVIASVTLATGVKVLSRQKVLVKHIEAIHDLGSLTILCTDKTGTLTEFETKLVRSLKWDGTEDQVSLTYGALNSFFGTDQKNPLNKAILEASPLEKSPWTLQSTIPFDFEKRISVVSLKQEGKELHIMKGAPESLLPLCAYYGDGVTQNILSQNLKTELFNLYEQESNKAYRVLGVAIRSSSSGEWTFLGFLLFSNPPKKGVQTALQSLDRQNIKVYILTGDNASATRALCENISFPIQGIITGDTIDTLSNDAFKSILKKTNLYCRLTPLQKKRIILGLKELGHVVGFLGDGINDALALQAAHVGIAVDSAAEVAKETADLILTQHDLGVLSAGVTEGRKIYANLIKYILMMLGSNFGNVLSMTLAFIFLPFLPMLPTQILLNDLLYDLAQTSLPFDRVDPNSMLRPQHWNKARMVRFMTLMGGTSTLFDLVFFFILLKYLKVEPPLFQTLWFMESHLTQLLAIFIVRTRAPLLKSDPHPLLVVLCLSLAVIGLGLPFTPLGAYFGFCPPSVSHITLIFGFTGLYLFCVEKMKPFIWGRGKDPLETL